MTLDESIQGLRLRVMRRAEQIGNVSQVCTEFGISWTLFCRWRRPGIRPRPVRPPSGNRGAESMRRLSGCLDRPGPVAILAAPSGARCRAILLERSVQPVFVFFSSSGALADLRALARRM